MRRFVNWARTVESAPREWHAPRRDEEVADLVRAAARDGRRVRAVGAGHSFSAIAAPDDVALSLDGLAGVIAIDRERGLATVRGGTRLADLYEALGRAGLALPIVGSIAAQSVAGAIATGTHGSSLAHGNLASLVAGMRLVTGSGDVVDLGAADPRLDGSRVHLGALGVVVEVTLQVVPAFRLAETAESVPLAAVIGALPAIARSAEYVKVWWFPHTPSAQVFRYQRTVEAPTRRPDAARQRRIDDFLQQRVFPYVIAAERLRPALIPSFNRALARSFLHPRRVGASELMLSTPMPVVHRETEAALPLARADEALDRLVRMAGRAPFRVNVPIEVRFVRGDGAWMSPAHGGDTCQIGGYMGGVPGVDDYFAAFWRELRPLGARPHWGKEMDHRLEELRPLYPLADRFLALRDELDPGRRFATPFHNRVLGP